jgi:UDP-N-acetylglucosamine--N-acetylmuramyl-(pentapeptide) pyrophosphoryl-undecaprenol N-acetylglucosamine transferase
VNTQNTKVLIMAAGTGGHVFPALSIAQCLRDQGVITEWLGTRHGMENNLLENSGIKIHPVSVKGLKGKGIVRLLLAPFMMLVALVQSMRVIARVKPNCVLGMGGFVSGPGGLATKLLGKPLLIHEQNAVPGFTNRMLARISNKVFEAFPRTFKSSQKVMFTGNPIREDIAALHQLERTFSPENEPLRILVLGGSQGALAINEIVPQIIEQWDSNSRPTLIHQSGKATLERTKEFYESAGIELGNSIKVQAFIEDMADVYMWADLVICRSGASTVSELAAVGLPSVLIPYPHHSDKQQSHNAKWLSGAGAAYLLEQSELSRESLSKILSRLQANRSELVEMSAKAKSLAVCNASELISEQCLELANG